MVHFGKCKGFTVSSPTRSVADWGGRWWVTVPPLIIGPLLPIPQRFPQATAWVQSPAVDHIPHSASGSASPDILQTQRYITAC